jgi:hypothetical protein
MKSRKESSNKMAGISTYISILNSVLMISIHQSKDMVCAITKQDPMIRCLQEMHLTDKNKHWLSVKGWK